MAPYGLYNPTSNYGASQNYSNSPLSGILLEQNPNVAIYKYGVDQGIGGGDSSFEKWFRSQYPQIQLAYGAATANNPYMRQKDFLPTTGGNEDWQRRFQAMSPQQRGENPNTYAPSVRTIRW